MGKTVGTLQLLIGCCKTTSESDRCQNDTDDRSKLPAPPPYQLKEYDDRSELPAPPPHELKLYGYKELAVATEYFSQDYLLGEGGFGQVYKATLDGEEVAIKKLKIIKLEKKLEESEFLTCVNHPNIVKMIGLCREGSNRVLVLEFVPNKTLTYHLHDEKNKILDWPTRMKIALQSANGLLYLHQGCKPKIIHRDMKVDNILLDNNFNAKVADFSLSNFLSDTDKVSHITSLFRGTNGYADPEYGNIQKISDKLDIYSFGVILLELITGRKPCSDYGDATIVKWAKSRIGQALYENDYTSLVDPRLKKYEELEMIRMIYCAAASLYKPSSFRPNIKQIIEVLDRKMLPEEIMDRNDIDGLLDGIPPNTQINMPKMYGFEELATATEFFSNAHLLGEGALGQVFKATLDGNDVVIKRLKRIRPENTLKEMKFLGVVRHPNLVKVIGYCSEGANRVLVSEFVPNRTLTYHLHGKYILDWSKRINIAIHSAKGLEYLHENCKPKVLHGYLKTNNILLDDNFIPKIADFGLHDFLPDRIFSTRVSTGSLFYADIDQQKLSEKSDVYFFGIILLELISGREYIVNGFPILYWAEDLIKQALDNGEYTNLVDSRLQEEYEKEEMIRMIYCVAASVYKPPRFRPNISKIVQVLEGRMPWSIIWGENDNAFLNSLSTP
ncbi:serine/threonine-protein kinase CDG1 isoform X3 [Manihot esculenta]|uniref:serine/threonine-protein kinase CDG1 isoform X3 n=1 Tax=Manihot esculenta TaxID=3983 RepID=UPI001CC7C4C7|nr:serine/threonine-protein kinase CDG1 isoform X3 [Manihot esculenta]